MSDADARRRQSTDRMKRITVRVPPERLDAIDSLVDAGTYQTQSEAVREALRRDITGGDWRPRRKPSRRDAPTVTVSDRELRLHKAAFEALGEPEHVRFLVDGDRLAIVPTQEHDPDAYCVFGDSTQQIVSATWLSSELERGDQPKGRFPLVDHDGLHVVDFSEDGDA